MWSNPPLIFTGYVAVIEETSTNIRLTCLDALGFLTNEYITEEPAHANGNISTMIKSIVAESSYKPPIARIISDFRFNLPTGLKFKGKTRLAAIQTLLSFVNSGPVQYQIYADAYGYVHVAQKKELHDSNVTPYVAGRVPKTTVPHDFYPTMIERVTNDDDFFNKVTVENEELDISATVSLTSERPVHRYVKDTGVTTVAHAETLGRQILMRQGIAYSQWIVEGLPERFDLRAGDIMDFASVDGGLAGRQELFSVGWQFSTDDSVMTLTVGKQPSDIAATMRMAAGLSVQ